MQMIVSTTQCAIRPGVVDVTSIAVYLSAGVKRNVGESVFAVTIKSQGLCSQQRKIYGFRDGSIGVAPEITGGDGVVCGSATTAGQQVHGS
jgi:hypothetical protein